MTTKRSLTKILTGMLVTTTLAAGCSGAASTEGLAGEQATETSTEPDMSPVLLIGDSVAVGQALPLNQAFAASNVRFTSIAAEGGGNVVGPFSEDHWKELPEQISSAEPAVVIYQITTYDWGTEEEQRVGYEKLLAEVTDAGADLIFVTMPPIEPDDFYEPHMTDLNRAPDVARGVADSSDGQAHVLDASAVWGDTYQQTRDGKADRGSDGIHTCPQGAARFASWLLGELAEVYPDLSPAPAEDWANAGWSGDDHFKGC